MNARQDGGLSWTKSKQLAKPIDGEHMGGAVDVSPPRLRQGFVCRGAKPDQIPVAGASG